MGQRLLKLCCSALEKKCPASERSERKCSAVYTLIQVTWLHIRGHWNKDRTEF